jgi:PAS domain S-box-containing protein
MQSDASAARISLSGPIKNSIAVAVIGAVVLLTIIQWTALAVRKHIGIASLSVFPAALDSQQAGTAFERMNRDYSDAVVMQEKAALASADRDADTVVSALDKAAASMAFNHERHQQILSLKLQVAGLRARSKVLYATAAEANAAPPAQKDLAQLSRENKAVENALETLQDGLTGDFRAELDLINKLSSVQGILEAVVLAGVIIALFFSTRALIKATVQRREDEVMRQTHAALNNERRILRTLIDNIPDFMYVKDTQCRFMVANLHLAHVVGVGTPEELLGKTDFDFFPRTQATRFYEDEQAVIHSGQPLYNRDEKGTDSAGNEIHILTTKVPLLDSEGHIIGIAGVGHDISGRTKMEEALRGAEQKFRGIFDRSIIGIYQCSPEGRFFSVNPAMAHTFGYDSPEEMIAHITDLSQQFFVDPGRYMQFMLTMDRREGVKNFECEVFRKDGVKIWLNMSILAIRENGAVVRCEGMSEDITRRKQMENDLREAELKYRGIFDKAVIGIFQSTPEGRFLSVNPAMALTIGYDFPEEMIASITDMAHQFYVDPKRREEFKASVEKLDAVQNFDCEILRKDGSKIWLSMSVRAIREYGKVVRYEGMCQDITERILLREQLLQAQKLESVGQLAAGIAHEINTPTQYIGDNVRFLKDAFQDMKGLLDHYERLLSAAKGNALSSQTLREIGEEVERVDTGYLLEEIPKAIDQTLEGVTRVSTIVSAMKEFSHPDVKEKVPVNLNHAIASTITVARNEWKYVAEMETEFDPSLPPVLCLPGEFNQVILNLIVNAAHAIADVAKKGGPTMGKIKVQTINCVEWVEIRIQDSGTGIPETVRTRIFDPFFTTKEIGKGTGQGLAIARSVIINKHGGSIRFETEEGKGTTFIVRLSYDGKALSNQEVAA